MSQTLNSAAVTPIARRPRLRVLINGTATPAVIAAQCDSNNWYASDKFSATFAVNGDPALPAAF